MTQPDTSYILKQLREHGDAQRGATIALENALHQLVADARREGKSWQDIGQALDISRQAAWERFHWLEQ